MTTEAQVQTTDATPEVEIYVPPKRMAVVVGTLVIDIVKVGASDYKYPHHDDAVLVEDDDGTAGINTTMYDGKQFVRIVVHKPRAAMIRELVELCDAIYEKPTRYAEEYKLREAQALAYKAALDANTALPAAPMVQDYADALGVTLGEAVTNTLTQAAMLRGALPIVGKWRMQKTYFARADVTDEQATSKFEEAMRALSAIASAIT